MKKTILHFKNIFQLWNFKKRIAACDVEIDLSSCTLFCNCKTEDVRLAIDNFGATVQADRSLSNTCRSHMA